MDSAKLAYNEFCNSAKHVSVGEFYEKLVLLMELNVLIVDLEIVNQSKKFQKIFN